MKKNQGNGRLYRAVLGALLGCVSGMALAATDVAAPWQDWHSTGTRVEAHDAVLSVTTSQIDAGGVAVSPLLTIDPTKVIVVARRVRLAYGSAWTAMGMSLVFDQTPDFLNTLAYGLKPKGVFVTYARYRFANDQMREVEGAYIGDGSAEKRSSAVGEPGEVPWGAWFQEKVVFNPQTGDAELWINEQRVSHCNVGRLSPQQRYLKLYLDAYGWYTGHAQETRDLSVTQVVY